ncbi:BgTH12-07595 [Blumeria graminis f. sp. triticale]|uniref:BgTH12-07595 n=1 Tax=Blumeria graminis f. sp. triticale TaxID=1689686 RepID=A0A9W4CX84_BLUGR|nr:BgTH12-07595 [Blumeria graminis f. sp. triticale]
MKFLNVSLITTTLSLFTSFGAAQADDEDTLIYTCSSVKFYLESVCLSAMRVLELGRRTIDGYPTLYNAEGLNGSIPHKLFPMIPGVLVFNGRNLQFFLIVDGAGHPQGMVYLYREGDYSQHLSAVSPTNLQLSL